MLQRIVNVVAVVDVERQILLNAPLEDLIFLLEFWISQPLPLSDVIKCVML